MRKGQEAISYVRSMSTHITIWIKDVKSDMLLLKENLGKRKLRRHLFLFSCMEANLSIVVELIKRMEEGLIKGD